MSHSNHNPFVDHADVFRRGYYSAARKLRRLALSMWNGQAFPFEGHWFRGLDENHFAIAMSMIHHYHRHGENDVAFMNLCSELREIELRAIAAENS